MKSGEMVIMVEFVCSQCPRRCGALRGPEGGNGYCGMGSKARIARAALHFWEEPCISSKNGSGTIFFSGCALRCVYCQNYRVSHGGYGREVDETGLRRLFHRLIDEGAHNINLVTPTHYAHVIRRALLAEPLPVPVVYNSGGYDSVDTLKSLEGLISVYLPDLKYGRRSVAGLYSDAPDYPETARAALLEMRRQQPQNVVDAQGILQRGMLVRHLILPGQAGQSRECLTWLSQALPGVPVSLMAQYTPQGEAAGFPALRRPLREHELSKVLRTAQELDLTGYTQERTAATEAYIPPFEPDKINDI